MDEIFVPYDLALKLKDIGFNESCIATFDNSKNKMFAILNNVQRKNTTFEHIVTAPSWEQVFEWFRNTHNLEGMVKSFKEGGEVTWLYSVQEVGKVSSYMIEKNTYITARYKCIKKLINKIG